METHNLVQGSPEWLAYRATKYNSSDAPAMMGVSPYKTRTQLLNEMKSGVTPEVDLFTQELFKEGHRCEALCRPVAAGYMGEDLYPAVCSEGKLSASLDGITMLEDKVWEHKMLNAELRAMFAEVEAAGPQRRTDKFNELLHPMYRVQMQQQCIVTGVNKVLFSASEWTPEGELVEVHQCWYRSDPELARQIIAGWKQFEADLAAHEVSTVDTPKPVAAVIEELPALVVRVEGRVVSSNLGVYRDAAKAFLAKVKTDLQTDQDFADAERMVGFCKSAEERLELVKSQALAETKTIDELFRTVDGISEELRQTRLKLDKAVKSRKEQIRNEVVSEGAKAIFEHATALNERLGADWIRTPPAARYGEVIKGKKTVESLRNAVNTAVAQDKIELSALADRMEANRKALVRPLHDSDEFVEDYFFLFADFATVGQKPGEDFAAIADARIRAHHEAEERREAAKAQVAPAPVAAPAPAPVAAPAVGRRIAASPPAAVPTITAGTAAELRNEWQAFELALGRVISQIDKHSAEVDRRRFVVALARMRIMFEVETEGEVTC